MHKLEQDIYIGFSLALSFAVRGYMVTTMIMKQILFFVISVFGLSSILLASLWRHDSIPSVRLMEVERIMAFIILLNICVLSHLCLHHRDIKTFKKGRLFDSLTIK
jgi:hypothetical protein